MVTRRRRFSLRTVSLVASLVAIFVIVVLTLSLLGASKKLRRSAQTIEQEMRAVTLTEAVDRTLRDDRRIGNLWIATGEPELEASRSEVRAELRRSMAELEAHVRGSADGNGSEARLLAELYARVDRYLAEDEAVEARELPLEEIVQRVRPSLERALASSASMRRYNEDNLDLARGEFDRIIRLESQLAVVSAVVLALGLVVVALGFRLLVLRPLLDIQGAIRRFRRGDADAKASEEAVGEMADLAATFNEMADATVRARRDQLTFLAAVAHDLRNPLQALKMGVHALGLQPDPIPPERCSRVERQIDRLTRMVGDLLDGARIEAGQLELQLDDFDLRAAAQAMVDLFAPTTTTHHITLRAPDHPVLVHGDSLRIEQVLSNLLSNAIKYSPGGGPVEVAVSRTEGEAELSVSDRGLGIPAEEIGDVFLPFRRRPATGAILGIGLGLSIVARIVKAHGGRIAVESTPGAGSTFRAYLPLGRGPAASG
jgi:signal transduction histidine kinase